MVSGQLLDWFAVAVPVTSLDLSPVGDFMATTHVGLVGVYLVANRTHFTSGHLQPLKPATDLDDVEDTSTAVPWTGGASAEGGGGDEASYPETEEALEAGASEYRSAAQLADDLITMSALPPSRWATLSSLQDIKERNKPIEPPKAPKLAPFFLPTAQGLEGTPQFLAQRDVIAEAEAAEKQTKVLNFGKLGFRSEFQELLLQCAEEKDCRSRHVWAPWSWRGRSSPVPLFCLCCVLQLNHFLPASRRWGCLRWTWSCDRWALRRMGLSFWP